MVSVPSARNIPVCLDQATQTRKPFTSEIVGAIRTLLTISVAHSCEKRRSAESRRFFPGAPVSPNTES